jgi:hypothetical protein
VWKVAEGRVQRAAIEAGEVENGRVLIRSGLQGGDRVVLGPVADLREGQLVEVLP